MDKFLVFVALQFFVLTQFRLKFGNNLDKVKLYGAFENVFLKYLAIIKAILKYIYKINLLKD